MQKYNSSLYINRDARTQDALEYLQRNLTRHHSVLAEEEQDNELDKERNCSFEDKLVAVFKSETYETNKTTVVFALYSSA